MRRVQPSPLPFAPDRPPDDRGPPGLRPVCATFTLSAMPDPRSSAPAPSSPAPSTPTQPPTDATAVAGDARGTALRAWLDGLAVDQKIDPTRLSVASDDASFRRYFRVAGQGGAPDRIVMDAPPPMEDCAPFVHAARVFGEAGVCVPTVHAADLGQGFLLLDDLGSTTYLARLDPANAQGLYEAAGETLVRLQQASRPGVFPDYDATLLGRELNLFPEWYLGRHLGLQLDEADRQVLERSFKALLANNLAQPQVHVHRDYHSRNLMVLADRGEPGVLDFQDAVYGPITYDLVSLLRDAYIRWDEDQVLDWAIRYWQRARQAGLPVHADFGEFYRDFEWMGLQRHLKILGIFARLYHRDGKDRYLADLPLVRHYVRQVLRRYGEFAGLLDLFERLDPDEAGARQIGYTF